MTQRVVIHRDRTFQYQGKSYRVIGANASEGEVYEIVDLDFNSVSDEDFNSIADLRNYLDDGLRNGWPIERENSNAD